ARAEIAEMVGNPDLALKHLREARKNGENSPGMIVKLVTLLFQRGLDKEAGQVLESMRDSLGTSKELEVLAISYLLQNKEMDRAIERTQARIREETASAKELVFLGQVYALAKQPVEAEKRFRKAIGRNEADPMPWVALVQFLAGEKGRAKDAEAEIDKA